MKALTEAPPALVTMDEIEAAAGRIQVVAVRTPLLPFPEVSEESGGAVRLKCESLQRTGSFKIRGAYNFVSQLSPEEMDRGIITYSSGNHAQAVALAAREKGVRAVVVMPTTAPGVKVDGARRLGAEVVFEGTTSIERKVRAEAIASEEGLAMVPPFDHPHIIAGQGTVGLEIARDWPEVDLVLVPIGGGGLAGGTAAALKRLLPRVRVVGVEPEGAPAMRAALDAGEPVTLPRTETIADGLAPVRAGSSHLPPCQGVPGRRGPGGGRGHPAGYGPPRVPPEAGGGVLRGRHPGGRHGGAVDVRRAERGPGGERGQPGSLSPGGACQ
jgi:threo-3-hydroxy-L-aspartate ammonia-lyase